jgi:CRISPR-associated protein Cas2
LFVLITYDVNTETPAGKKRLRSVAKTCKDYGQRVQNSVFECIADSAQMVKIKNKLIEIINQDTDSLRFYFMGNEYKAKVEHYGAKPSVSVNDVLII